MPNRKSSGAISIIIPRRQGGRIPAGRRCTSGGRKRPTPAPRRPDAQVVISWPLLTLLGYLDMMWEKGILYFVRDYYAKDTAACVRSEACGAKIVVL